MINHAVDARATGHQEFSSRALVKIVPIMLLLLGPLFLILVCVGYRVFVKTKKAQANKWVPSAAPDRPESRPTHKPQLGGRGTNHLGTIFFLNSFRFCFLGWHIQSIARLVETSLTTITRWCTCPKRWRRIAASGRREDGGYGRGKSSEGNGNQLTTGKRFSVFKSHVINIFIYINNFATLCNN